MGRPEIADPQQAALFALFEAIAARDGAAASRMLAKSPALARIALESGATRASAAPYFFDAIGHYAYAGDTGLHLAAAAHHRRIAEELLANAADVHAANRRGAQPLHYAADGKPGSEAYDPHAQHEVVVCLIEAGADPNARDKSGVAPLHRAVRTRCTAAVAALLTHGSDALSRNASGSTPLHLAVQNTGRGGSGSAAAKQEQAAIIRLLLDNGARGTDEDASGKSVDECVKADWIRELLELVVPRSAR